MNTETPTCCRINTPYIIHRKMADFLVRRSVDPTMYQTLKDESNT